MSSGSCSDAEEALPEAVYFSNLQERRKLVNLPHFLLWRKWFLSFGCLTNYQQTPLKKSICHSLVWHSDYFFPFGTQACWKWTCFPGQPPTPHPNYQSPSPTFRLLLLWGMHLKFYIRVWGKHFSTWWCPRTTNCVRCTRVERLENLWLYQLTGVDMRTGISQVIGSEKENTGQFCKWEPEFSQCY